MENLESQCQNLLKEKTSIEEELAKALGSLKLSEDKSSEIQSQLLSLPSSEDMQKISAKAERLEKELSELQIQTKVTAPTIIAKG